MSFRRAFVPSLLLMTACCTGAAFAQEPSQPAPAPATEPAATPAAAPAATAAADATPHAGDAKTGEAKAAVCAACHGMDGNPSDKQYPKLAGQNEAYIARQLGLFKSQARQNPIMLGFASTLSAQDAHDVGAFFATKAALPGVADDKYVERGQALYRGGDAKLGVPACMACHGPDGRGMAGAGFPQLGGQWADYVQAKLKDWKSGTTWGTDNDAQIMPAIAQRLSDEDIAALASYVEGLHSADAGTSTASK